MRRKYSVGSTTVKSGYNDRVHEAKLSFLGVPPRPPFSLRSMADRVQFENERSENGGLGVCPQESTGEDIATSRHRYSQVLLYYMPSGYE